MSRLNARDAASDLAPVCVLSCDADFWADGEPQDAALAHFEATCRGPLPSGCTFEGPEAIVEFTLRLALRDTPRGRVAVLNAAQQDVVCDALARCLCSDNRAASAFSFRDVGELSDNTCGSGDPSAGVTRVFLRCRSKIALARRIAAGFSNNADTTASHVSAKLRAAFPALLLPDTGAQPAVALLAATCKAEVILRTDMSACAQLLEKSSTPAEAAAGLNALKGLLRTCYRNNADDGSAAERAGDFMGAVLRRYHLGELHEEEGRLAAAESEYERCVSLFDRGVVPPCFKLGGTQADVHTCLLALGLVQKKQAKWDAAEQSYTAALARLNQLGDSFERSFARHSRLLIMMNMFSLFYEQRAAEKCKRLLRLWESTLEAEQDTPPVLHRDADFEWLRFRDAEAAYAVCFGATNVALRLARANKARAAVYLGRADGNTVPLMDETKLGEYIAATFLRAEMRQLEESSAAAMHGSYSARLLNVCDINVILSLGTAPVSERERIDATKKLAACEAEHAALLAEFTERGIDAPHGAEVGASLKAIGDAQLAVHPDDLSIGLTTLRAAADEYPAELHGRVDFGDVLLSTAIALLRSSCNRHADDSSADESSREGTALLLRSFDVFRSHFSGAGAPTLVPIWTAVARAVAMLGAVDAAAQLMTDCAALLATDRASRRHGRGAACTSDPASALATALKQEAAVYTRIVKQCINALGRKVGTAGELLPPSPAACLRHLRATRTLMQQLRDAQPTPEMAAAACRGLLSRSAQVVICANPGCGEVQRDSAFKRCAKCTFAAYCSKVRRLASSHPVISRLSSIGVCWH